MNINRVVGEDALYSRLTCAFHFQIQAQKVRLSRTQGPYYTGSLPNVNQIGRNPSEVQVRVWTEVL